MLDRRSFLAAIVFASALASAQTSSLTPDVGAKASNFTLNTPEGKSVTLADLYRDGPVVLVLLRGYPGYQCPYCQAQAHDFQVNAGQFAALHAQVLLVYPGPPAGLDGHATQFLTKQEAFPDNFRLVTDPDYKMTNQYGLRWDSPRETAYPSTFLLDRHGVVFFRKISTEHGNRSTAAELVAALKKHETPQ